MASEALFAELAKALGQPSRASRAVTAAADIPFEAMKGYDTAAEFGDSIRKRKLAQQTLHDALGGQMPAGTEGFGNLTTETADALAKPITAFAALDKANKEGQAKTADFMSLDQATKSLKGIQGGDLSQEDSTFLGAFPSGQIPRLDFSQYASAKTSRDQANTRGEMADSLNFSREENLWKDLGDRANFLKQSGGPLGMAAKANLRGYRALDLLANDKITPQMMNLVNDDLKGIMVGGVTPVTGIDESKFKTLQAKWANLQTWFGNPTPQNTPAVAAELKNVISGLRQIDNAAVINNLNILEHQFAGTIKRHEGNKLRWQNIRTQTERALQKTGIQGDGGIAGNPNIEAAKQWLAANPDDPTAPAVRAKLQSMEGSSGF